MAESFRLGRVRRSVLQQLNEVHSELEAEFGDLYFPDSHQCACDIISLSEGEHVGSVRSLTCVQFAVAATQQS